MENNNIFSFGKFDKNDIKHLLLGGVIGYVIYCLIVITYGLAVKHGFFTADLGIHTKWISLIILLFGSLAWEFRQLFISRAKIDIKDILISCILWLTVCIFT